MNEENAEKKQRQPASKHWDRFLSLLPYVGVTVLGLLGLGLALAIVGGVLMPHSIVRELSDADLARGVITFIFAVGTIGIALLLSVGALVGKTGDEFTKGKEVLAVLIGVFGTILGFYFGTSKAPSATSAPASPASSLQIKNSKSRSLGPTAASSTSTPAAAQSATAAPSPTAP